IVALANQNMHRHTPFVFGGDGITMLCPPEYLEKIKDILHGIRDFVKGSFGLDMRVGIVSVREILQEGYELMVGKFSEKDPIQQALFWGNGFEYAENLVKSGNSKYNLSLEHSAS